MARYTTTPWRHQRDLLSVRSKLYSQDPALQRHAINRVMAWKLRSNLPHAVESTALLVDAILHHDLTHNSIFSIRAVYAAAFTRFVTGFCDIGRNRERLLEPSSMLEIAKQIGMPVEFVALRHEATHEELPSVQRLVAVCGQALEWLWRVYWERLEEPIVQVGEGVMRETEVQGLKDEVRRVLKDFRSARRQGLKARSAAVQNQELVQSTASSIAGLGSGRKEALSIASEVFVDEKMLYPSDREIGASLDGAYLLWDDVLLAISSQQTSFLPILVDRMLSGLSLQSNARPEYDSGKDAFFHWLSHLATSPSWRRKCQDLRFDAASRMMSHCCLHPGFWSQRLGETLVKASDSQDFIDTWSELLAASALGVGDTSIGGDGAVKVQTKAKSNDDLKDTMSVDDNVMGGWRAAVFAPTAPIGVVR